MNIMIAGNGKVGSTLTRLLSAEGHDITLIDTNSNVLEESQEQGALGVNLQRTATGRGDAQAHLP